jgi:hypothetical protein
MKLISYRGNINGPNPESENTVPYINDAISEGYVVAVDVWLADGKLYLCTTRPHIASTSRSRGYHVGPAYYEVSESYLENNMILVRARTPDTLVRLAKNGRVHCFHTDKQSAVTSQGFLWTTRDVAGPNVIRVSLEGDPISPCYAACSSYIRNYGRPNPDQAILVPQKIQQIREMREQGGFLEQQIAELSLSLESLENRKKELAEKETELFEEIQQRLSAINELINAK